VLSELARAGLQAWPSRKGRFITFDRGIPWNLVRRAHKRNLVVLQPPRFAIAARRDSRRQRQSRSVSRKR
jgi:hypothetical protein